MTNSSTLKKVVSERFWPKGYVIKKPAGWALVEEENKNDVADAVGSVKIPRLYYGLGDKKDM